MYIKHMLTYVELQIKTISPENQYLKAALSKPKYIKSIHTAVKCKYDKVPQSILFNSAHCLNIHSYDANNKDDE